LLYVIPQFYVPDNTNEYIYTVTQFFADVPYCVHTYSHPIFKFCNYYLVAIGDLNQFPIYCMKMLIDFNGKVWKINNFRPAVRIKRLPETNAIMGFGK
jgi:hypothetical protein